MNFLFQGVLLYLIFESVVLDNVDWQNGILKMGKDPVIGLVTDAPGKCNDASALCFRDNGNYSCAPPSIQLTGRWSEAPGKCNDASALCFRDNGNYSCAP